VPFLITTQGLTQIQAGQLLSLVVVLGIAIGPVLGAMVGRYPLRRSQMTLGIVAVNAVMWTVVLLQSGPSPLWLLILLCIAMAFGGPGSMIGLDHARSWNPLSRLGAAQGLVNSGGFFAAVLSISGVGVVLEWAGDYSLSSFRLAFAVMYPLWLLGTIQVIRYRRRVRALRMHTSLIT
jgi:MFS family permease